MKYFRVKVPQVRERFLRRVDPGTTLAKDCSSPSGQLLFRKGVELDLDRLSKLKRFGVRRVSVEVEEEKWLSRPEVDDLPGSPEILDEKEVEQPEDDSAEPETTDESEVLDSAFMRLNEGAPMREAQNLARKLRTMLRQDGNTPGGIDEIAMELYGLEEEVESLDDELKGRLPERERRRILRSIRGLNDGDLSDLTEGLDDEYRDRTQELEKSLEELRTRLMSFLHENDDELLETLRQQDALPDVLTEENDRKQPSSGKKEQRPRDQGVEEGTLFESGGLGQLLDRVENERLFETLMEQYKNRLDPSGSSPRETSEGDAKPVSRQDELTTRLRKSLGDLQEYSERERKLQRDIHRDVNDPDLIERLSRMVETGELDDAVSVQDHPVLQNLMERVRSFIDEQQSMKQRIEQLMDQMSNAHSDPHSAPISEGGGTGSDKRDESRPNQTPPSRAPIDLSRSMELFEDGQWTKALDEMLHHIDATAGDSAGLEGRLQALREQMEEKVSERHRIREEIQREAEDEDLRERLTRVLDGNQELTLDEMAQTGISADLLQSIADFQTGRKEWADQLEEVTARLFETVSGEVKQDKEEFVDRVSSAYETEKRSGRTPPSPGSNTSQLDISTRQTDKGEDSVPELPEEVRKTARQLYDRPAELNKWQRHLMEPVEELIEVLLEDAHWTRQAGVRFIRRVKEVLDSTNRPFELLVLNAPEERYLLAHSYNAALVCVLLGEHLEVENDQLIPLVSAATWMDLGLTAVPMSMYLHEGTLSVRGRQEVHKHPIYSWKIVGRATGTESVPARLVLNHHERVDGEGYPFRRAFEDQPPLTPFLGAADVYTSLIEPRSFREGLMPNEALSELEDEAGQFHPRVVAGIREQFGLYPNGSVVKLSDGRIGMVSRQNPADDLRPDLLVFTDHKQNKLSKPVALSLGDERGIEIDRILRRIIHGNLTG